MSVRMVFRIDDRRTEEVRMGRRGKRVRRSLGQEEKEGERGELELSSSRTGWKKRQRSDSLD